MKVFRSTDSSVIDTVGYDDENQVMKIRFVENGSIWRYTDVPANIFTRLCAAKSTGKFYNKRIRGQFAGTRDENLPI